jgi:hypothetical protein
MPNVERSTSGRPPSAQPELDMDDVPVDEPWSPFVPSVEPPPPVEPVSVDPPAPFVAAGTSPSRVGSATPPPGGVQTEATVEAGSVAAPLEVLPVLPDVATPVPTPTVCERQVQVAGHWLSVVHGMTFGWQKPGKLVVVPHVGVVDAPPSLAGWLGALEALVAGVGAPPLPEQKPDTFGMQVKPSPQSRSALHGSSHLYLHNEVVVGVHDVLGSGVSHFVPAAQAPPLPAQGIVWVLHTMSAAQSPSVAHVAGSHELTVEVPPSTIGSGATTGHAAFFGQGGCTGKGVGKGIIVVTHVKPFPQSVVPQGAAWARAPASAPTRHPTVRISFGRDENDMSVPFVK